MGDNDSTFLIWCDEDGKTIESVPWEEARARLAAMHRQDSEAAGYSENRSEDLLCAVFTGVAAQQTGEAR